MCANKVESDLSLIRYSEDGDIVWSKRYNTGGYTHGKTIARSPNGNILVAGFIGSVTHIMEVSEEDGTINWVKTYPGSYFGFSGKAKLTVLEDDIVLDLTMMYGGGYVLRINEAGEVLEALETTYTPRDYNKIEMIGQTGMYYYGSILKDGFEGMIQRVENMWEENCLLKPSEFEFVATEYTDFFEVDFTPFEWGFTNESSIDIALVNEQVRVKYLCEVYLSTEVLDNERDIEVYPNPSDGMFSVNVPEELIGANYTLTDMTGKVITKGITSISQSNIDLSEFPNGQYILGIVAEGQTYTQKLVVLK
ncbi:MAG: T9SS type A sorting domain-containing protein [Crocinitomix sp.]|nr:T9SS type A sorting domain-containing protein [Crocinitomix sp.]